MANANLCMFVNACTYVLGLNERYVRHMYIAYVWEESWQQYTNRERDTQKETEIKHRGLYHTFCLLNGVTWKKQDHSLQSSVWVQIKNTVFNFDIGSKSVVGIQ